MDISLEDFCIRLHPIKMSQTRKAISVLWYHDALTANCKLDAGALSRILQRQGLGSPHSTRLGEAIRKTGLVLVSPDGFQLKPTARDTIKGWISEILGPSQPPLDHTTGYLPEHVWLSTRNYIESVVRQINGCYAHAYFDGAAVLIRRIVETLLIDCYEELKRENEIKDANGNYAPLGEIVTCTNRPEGLSLSRDAKRALSELKAVGDRAAHNRRYTTGPGELRTMQPGIRLVVQELVQLARLQKSPQP